MQPDILGPVATAIAAEGFADKAFGDTAHPVRWHAERNQQLRERHLAFLKREYAYSTPDIQARRDRDGWTPELLAHDEQLLGLRSPRVDPWNENSDWTVLAYTARIAEQERREELIRAFVVKYPHLEPAVRHRAGRDLWLQGVPGRPSWAEWNSPEYQRKRRNAEARAKHSIANSRP